MTMKKAVRGTALGLLAGIIVGFVAWMSSQAAPGMQSTTTAALTGSVTSRQGRMEGVLVRARRDGSNITVSVVSNATGVYSFPRNRLEPGEYTIKVRAAGYALRPSTRVKIAGDAASVKDLALEETSGLEKALQLSSGEWLQSYPLPHESLQALMDCTRCHDQQRVAMSRFNEKQLLHVMQRMTSYWLGSTPVTYQLTPATATHWGRRGGVQARPPSRLESRQAAAVAAINLSNGPWQYPLKTYPRPTGENTNVIYTTYDLPRVAAKPHDVQIGPDGWIYYSDFNDQVFGKLNPKTGATVEWDLMEKLPQLDEEGVMMPAGNRIVMYDGQGKFYLSPPGLRGGEGYAVVFDTKSEEFEFYPGAGHFVAPQSIKVDGYVWINRLGQVSRVKFLGDGKMTKEVAGEKLGAYDTYVDSKNNVYGGSRESSDIWRVDAKTLGVTRYPIPKQPRGETGFATAGPRRGLFDRQDRLWFGGFDGNVIGKLEPNKPVEQAIQLYRVPLPWFQPYMTQGDDAGYVWTGSISADYVARMNEKTGQWNLYLLPSETNIRHIRVQPADSGGLSSLWVGANHQGQIVHIEPLAR